MNQKEKGKKRIFHRDRTYFLFLALVGSSSWFSSAAMDSSGSSLLTPVCEHRHNTNIVSTESQEWLQHLCVFLEGCLPKGSATQLQRLLVQLGLFKLSICLFWGHVLCSWLTDKSWACPSNECVNCCVTQDYCCRKWFYQRAAIVKSTLTEVTVISLKLYKSGTATQRSCTGFTVPKEKK